MVELVLTRAIPVLIVSGLAAWIPSSLGTADASLTPVVRTSCVVEVQGAPESVTAAGERFSLAVTAAPDCKWTAVSEQGITITPGSGRGAAVVAVVVDANPGPARTAVIDFNGVVVQFSQPRSGTRPPA